uniref:Uncharacterized protein n=1 Tax=Knipowitschia caucasica TaxID=637954 RepID=A0AAV2J0A2_KNICA
MIELKSLGVTCTGRGGGSSAHERNQDALGRQQLEGTITSADTPPQICRDRTDRRSKGDSDWDIQEVNVKETELDSKVS